MQHILVYADSLSWGIIPTTRERLEFDQRWPGVMEIGLKSAGKDVRVIEDLSEWTANCLGRPL